jgi:tRNA (guanosine-2'-O-)-methyltransferase
MRVAPPFDRAALEQMVNAERQARLKAILAARLDSPAFILEDVHDPHNISAALRTIEGLGLHRMFVIEANTSFEINTRVTQGADKWLDIQRFGDIEACMRAVRAEGYRVLSTAMDAEATVDDIDWSQPVAVVMGNERDGVSPSLEAHVDQRFRVPMAGFSQSFNVSVATALIAYAATRHIRGTPAEDTLALTEEQRERRYDDYLWGSVNQRERIAEIVSGS